MIKPAKPSTVLTAAVAVVALTALLAACGSSNNSSGSSGGGGTSAVSVSVHDFAFAPVTDSVAPGSAVTVTIKNDGPSTHSFTLDSGGVDVVVDPGTTGTATFTAPSSGSVTFHCHFHPTMTGSITVGSGGAGAAPTQAPTSANGYGY